MQQDANGSEWPNKLPSMSNLYQPLDSSRQEIRLLHVKGRQDAKVVLTCTLEIVSLLDDPKPTYEAISYCWAEISGTATIRLNGTPVDVPGSAAKVLRQFQLQSSSRTLWIDAVCINQEDLDERNQQVALMGQIYRSSQGTLVWLGDSDNATERTLRTLNRISDEFYNHIYGSIPGFSDGEEDMELSKKFDKELEDDDVQLVIDFYRRPWFSRVWVIQEVVLAKISTCYSGPQTIPWNIICRSTRWLVDFLHRVNRGQEFETMRGMHLASLGLALQNRPTLPLAVILRAVKPLNCSNARDKFYGIYNLTMLPSLGQKFQDDYGVNIDYTKTMLAVFRDVTRVGILRHCNLEILKAIDDNSGSSCPAGASDWPSWVPRWDLGGVSIDLGGQENSAHGLPFGLGPVLSGDRKVDRSLALAYAATEGMQDCLPLRGYALDSVVAQISTFDVVDDAKGLQIQDLAKFISECFGFINTPTRLHLARRVITTLLSISHLDHVSPGTNESCFRLLYLSASVLTTGHIPGDEDSLTVNTYSTFKPWLPEIFTNIGIHCKNKNLFLTNNDRIGVSGSEVVVGDLVVALFGATDVYVLRSISQRDILENRPDSTQEKGNFRMRGYTLVSRSFIHGITNSPEPFPVEGIDTTETIFEIW